MKKFSTMMGGKYQKKIDICTN